MQVGDERFDKDEIQRLYDDAEYPLGKSKLGQAQRHERTRASVFAEGGNIVSALRSKPATRARGCFTSIWRNM